TAGLAAMLARAAAHAAAQQGGTDLGVQLFELARGDRKGIDWREVATSAEMGALAGAVAGAVHLGAGALAPKFPSSLAGHFTLGAVNGVAAGEATALTFGGVQSPGLLLASGLAGAAGGALR